MTGCQSKEDLDGGNTPSPSSLLQIIVEHCCLRGAMGTACCCPKYSNDLPDCENKFKVTNMDDDGKRRCPGEVLFTETDLVFRLKRGGFVKWPYYSLVRYGYNSEVFSFICGSRCQTGEGIFAFRCHHAEEMFEVLQTFMHRNRISVIQTTETENMESDSLPATPVPVTRLPYRSGKYPSFANAASSRRPEPIGGENRSASSLLRSPISQMKVDKVEHLLLEPRFSDGGAHPPEEQSFLGHRLLIEQYPGLTCSPRHPTEREEQGTLESRTTIRDSNCTFWDTGYDSDERRDVSCSRKMGYENLPGSKCRRHYLASVSSSDSQSYSIPQRQSALLSDDSVPSSPSIFEEKLNLGHKPPSPVNICNHSKPASLKTSSSAQLPLSNRSCAPVYFNFDIRHPGLEGKQLNYIEVEICILSGLRKGDYRFFVSFSVLDHND
ncbi:hypothetical protein NDU88_002675 [Pleurodeles waltl]|uniref:IRS-type PTB domain-containing protein n=1 Tax=Pleurodeles waltl TaxID=8319 RepID=A0AAV7M1N3_PLEWA|nr:hypothetical protein NDU88_002675 [Pleurodeles waltl]